MAVSQFGGLPCHVRVLTLAGIGIPGGHPTARQPTRGGQERAARRAPTHAARPLHHQNRFER